MTLQDKGEEDQLKGRPIATRFHQQPVIDDVARAHHQRARSTSS